MSMTLDMAEGAKSEDEDIWNYKSITRRAQSKPKVDSKEGGHIKNGRSRKKPDVFGRDGNLPSSSKTDLHRISKPLLADAGNLESEKRLINLEIIDVDSQLDFSETTLTNNSKNIFKSVKHGVSTKISGSGTKGQSLAKSSTPRQRAGARSQRKGRGGKVRKTSKSPSSSQGSSTSNKESVEGKKSTYRNIGNYFNVENTLTPRKRKSSGSGDHLFDSSDDDLIFVGEEKTPEKVHSKKVHVDVDNLPSVSGSQVIDHSLKVDGKELENCSGNVCLTEVSISTISEDKSNGREKKNTLTANVVDVIVFPSEEDDISPNELIERDNEKKETLEKKNMKECVATDMNVAGLDPNICESKSNCDKNLSTSEKTDASAKNLSDSSPRNGFFINDSDMSPGKCSTGSVIESTGQSLEKEVNPKDGAGSSDTVSPFNSSDQLTLLSTARKQTSIFSFFNQTSDSKKSHKSNFKEDKTRLGSPYPGQKSLSTITARPSLNQLKTIPSTSSAWSVQGQKRHDLQKAASEPTFGDGSFTGNDDPAPSGARNKRPCPFYKKMPGTNITVDAFRYGVIPGCAAYVLTHFHYDHYGGLTKKFAQPIYCSQVTGNLVESRLGVDKRWVNRLPMWQPCDVEGVTLTLMEANHCPGAVIILFELKDGRKYLHTGDFRACEDMEQYTMLKNTIVSELYLDTTYCNPSYAFPPQKEVIEFVTDLVLKYVAADPQTLIVCGAYTIGKERIFSAVAKVLDTKIAVMNDKKKVLDCLEDQELQSRITLDWSKGQVHVLPMGKLNQQALSEHLARHSRFKSILAFQPTGWTHSDKMVSLDNIRPKWSKNGITVYGVPYSEHSSFLELKRFVQFLRPKKILPTVNNGNPAARKKMEDIFRQWMTEDVQKKPSAPSSQQMKLNTWMS